MSETVRVYGGRKSVGRGQRSARTMGAWGGGIVFLLLLGVLLGYGYWTTRDTYPIERLIPARQTYHVVAPNLIANRVQLFQSRLWQAVPAGLLPLTAMPSSLTNQGTSFGMPEWVLNNLVPGACHFCGEDVRAFSDVLCVTKMTRIGCLLERLRRFVPGIEQDWAGGLNLRRLVRPEIPGGALYYAVRGRILLASPSRDSLMHALTLSADDAWDRKAFDEAFRDLGSDDLCGMVALDADDPLGGVFRSASFALQVEPSGAVLKLRAALRPEYQKKMQNLVCPGKAALLEPPKGIAEISINSCRTLRELWEAVGRALDKQEQFQTWWDVWANFKTAAGADPSGYPLGAAVTSVMANLGPGFRLSWLGMDLNEMLPMPLFALTADAGNPAVYDALSALPAIPTGAQSWDMYLRWDAEKQRVWLPFIGGPDMQPTGGFYQELFVFSTSSPVADSMLNARAQPAAMPPGNLYVSLRPLPCLKAALDSIAVFSEAHLLDQADTWRACVEPYLTNAAVLDQLTGLATLNPEDVTIEIRAICSAEEAK